MNFWPSWREHKLFAYALFAVLALLALFLLVKTIEAGVSARLLDEPTPVEHTISMEGVGKELIVPDIAIMSFGITTTKDTVADAQKDNSTSMNALIEKIKAFGIAPIDLQTKDYRAYEKIEWDQKTQMSVTKGWIVSQTLEVKIRDRAKISQIIEAAGQSGTTSIAGPVFKVEDVSKYEQLARVKAIDEAKKKAELIAQSLGLTLDHVIAYSEYKADEGGPQPYAMHGSMETKSSNAPNIEVGSQEIKLHVNITYLLKN